MTDLNRRTASTKRVRWHEIEGPLSDCQHWLPYQAIPVIPKADITSYHTKPAVESQGIEQVGAHAATASCWRVSTLT